MKNGSNTRRRVDHQVHHHLFEPAAVRLDRRQAGRGVDRQHVIEVMCDAACELPDGLHLLRLPELLLEPSALRNVVECHEVRVGLVPHNLRRVHLGGTAAAVGQGDLGLERFTRGQRKAEWLGQQLVGRSTEQCLCGWIGE
ncbi:MAG: hypothetical protein ABIF82_12955 [Planctomycetota bacterium]